MNPFKLKQLDEFTITDCEQYLHFYPYGEHIQDVKEHLKQLKKDEKDKHVVEKKKNTVNIYSLTESQANRGEVGKSLKYNVSQRTTNKSNTPSSKPNNIVKTAFVWLLVLVVTIVAGIILIAIIESLFPNLRMNSGVMRCVVIGILLPLGKCIKEMFD